MRGRAGTEWLRSPATRPSKGPPGEAADRCHVLRRHLDILPAGDREDGDVDAGQCRPRVVGDEVAPPAAPMASRRAHLRAPAGRGTYPGPGEAAAMTPEEHSRAFMAYVAGLLADVDRYLAAGTPDLSRDGAGYTVAGMYLTDAERAGFLRDLAAIVRPLLANAPGKGRRRRMLYSIFLPEPDSRSAVRTHQH